MTVTVRCREPRPKFIMVDVPGEDKRPYGATYKVQASAVWGTRTASFLVPIPREILPNTRYKAKIPQNVIFKRTWVPVVVAGGGGGAGQCGKGKDASLTPNGGDGDGENGCPGGRDGGAGGSRTGDEHFYAYGGAGFHGSAEYDGKQAGAKSFLKGSEGSRGGGFGGGGGGKFAGGGGGGYSGGVVAN
eukprot:766434-Hanusia_phi.AAC.3